METISNSILLQRIGHAVINNFWQSALILLCLVVFFSFIKLKAIYKFRIAQFASLLLFVIFIISVFGFTNFNNTAFRSLSNTPIYLITFYRLNDYFNKVLPFLAFLYLFFLNFYIFSFFRSFFHTRMLSKSGLKRVPANWKLYTEEIEGILSISKKVSVFLSEKVTTPLTIGYLKPIILIPIACVNQLTVTQMEAVIIHELVHIKRADYLFNFMNTIATQILFFNPFLKRINKIIDEERENACDDFVLQFRFRPEDYASGLLTLARVQTSQTSLALKASENNDMLMRRVKRMLNLEGNNIYFSGLNKTIMLFVVSLIFMLVTKPVYNSELESNNAKPFMNGVSFNKNEIVTPYYANMLMGNSINIHPLKVMENLDKVKTALVEISKKAPKQYVESTKDIATIQNKPESEIIEDHFDLQDNFAKQVCENKIVLTPELYNQLLSYYNFKKMQNTVASMPSDSILIKENEDTKNSYKKVITIETTDCNGDSKSFNITIEVYQ